MRRGLRQHDHRDHHDDDHRPRRRRRRFRQSTAGHRPWSPRPPLFRSPTTTAAHDRRIHFPAPKAPSVGSGLHETGRHTARLFGAVRTDPPDRPRWHGAGLSGYGPSARPARRSQGPVPRALRRPHVRGAFPEGGPGCCQPLPPQHRPRLRLGRGRWVVLHRHGVRRRPAPLRRPARPTAPAAGSDRHDRRRRGRGTGLRAPSRRGAPRCEAGQRPDHARRGCEGDRLRHRPGGQHGGEPDPDRRRHGHGRLFLSRAGRGEGSGRPQRHLLPRRRALRDGGRPPSLHRRLACGRGLEARARHSRPAS